MRVFGAGILALVLAACGSNEAPPEREAGSEAAPEVDAGLVALHGEGLVAGAESFYFAAGQNEVTTALANTLGEEGDVSRNDECGAGPVTSVRYGSDLTVNFQEGSLVGWLLSGGSEQLQVDSDARIGTSRETVRVLDGFRALPNSTLGEEFTLGENLGGILEDGKVSVLYAGTQCFFR